MDPGYSAAPAAAQPRGAAPSPPCISPLHTHDVTGVIHIEAPAETRFTLGERFQEWGVRLDDSCLGGYCEPDATIVVFVDGRRHSDALAAIELDPDEEIAVVIGTPPNSIPGHSTSRLGRSDHARRRPQDGGERQCLCHPVCPWSESRRGGSPR